MRLTVVSSHSPRRRLPLVALLLACAASPLGAQGLEVAIDGTVRGDDGSIPAQATIDVRSRATGATRHLATDARGRYLVLALAPGQYDVTAYALGYRPGRRDGIAVVIGERVRVDFTLEHGAVELAPTVVTADRRADVRRADVSTAITPEDVRDLPLGRNVLSAAVLAPGVRMHSSATGAGVPAAGPSNSARFGNIYLDGVEMKGLGQATVIGAGSGSIVSQDAVEQLRIMFDPYDVELGHGSAWIVSAVTWQGSNQLAGSVFAYGQNRDVVAKSTFEAEKPRFARGQLGGTLRGAIIHDRLFFAASFERQVTDNYVSVVPGRPAANPEIWSSYAGTFRAPSRNDIGTLRLTAPAGAHTVDLSLTSRRLAGEGGFGTRTAATLLAHDAGTSTRFGATSARLRDTWASGRFANEISIDVLDTRNDDHALRPGPAYRYPGLQLGNNSLPSVSVEHHVGIGEKLGISVNAFGREHLLKLGGDATRATGWGYAPSNRDGFFIFATDTSTQPATGIIGVGYNDSASTRDARVTAGGWLLDAYVQDQLHPVSPLTLTIGVRWDAALGLLNESRRLPFASDTTLRRVVGEWYLDDGDRRNTLDELSPRVSLVWDVGEHGRTFLRAGYGIMYDETPVYGALNERIFWQWRIYAISSPGTTDPAVLRQRIRGTAPNLWLFPDRMRSPSTRQWSVGFARKLGDGVALNVDYLDQHLRNATVTVRENVAPAAGRPRPLTTRYGDLVLWGDFGDGTYRGLLSSLSAERGRSRFTLAYTLSSARTEFNVASTNDYPDSADYRMQRSAADERHRVVATEAMRLPWGITISTIGILASPQPFLVIVGTDVNHNGVTGDDWPGGLRTARNGGSNNWYRELDARVAKSVRGSRGELTFTADVFNVFNVGNHSDYQGVQTNLAYRKPLADYARRQGQLGLRYSF